MARTLIKTPQAYNYWESGMSTYRKHWECCDSVTETEGWEPNECPFCNARDDRQLVECPKCGEQFFVLDDGTIDAFIGS